MSSSKYKLSSDLTILPGVGPKLKEIFRNINIQNIRDLAFYFPRYYKDYRNTKNISDLSVNEEVTLKGKIVSSNLLRARTRIYEVILEDDYGRIKIIWFNPFYRYLKDNFKVGNFAIISGKTVKSSSSKYLQIVNPKPENIIINDFDETDSVFGKISSIYPLTKGLTQNRLSNMLKTVANYSDLESLDFFTKDIMKEYNLCSISESILFIHQPTLSQESPLVDIDSSEDIYKSVPHKTFVFFEFLILCLGIKHKEKSKPKNVGFKHTPIKNNGLYEKILKEFPFSLTSSQYEVLEEIISDMTSKLQMNRLLQGDVGSGKTIVALLSMAISYDSGYQSALIAPTEILVDQHFLYLKNFIDEEEIVILKSSLNKKEKEEAKKRIQSGKARFVVGTHSLFQEGVNYKNLGMVVIDEQHRFGVLQRKLMTEKGGNPDVLVMTATPIPRTLSNVFFADYDISKIKEMPKNRGMITTKVASINDSKKVYHFLINELKNDKQAFILCPLINKSENIENESLVDTQSLYSKLKKTELKDFNIGVIHGKLASSEKERLMEDFRLNKIKVLISTTVIEVGVDVPNASIMMIYNPERFGLSQLHQLRGRIGRGKHSSTCILMVDEISELSKERLVVFKNNLDGFKISEKDMEIRGPGAFYGAGVEQSGKFWDLFFANIRRDILILNEANFCAKNIEKYEFYKKNEKCFDELILSIWGDKLNLTKII